MSGAGFVVQLGVAPEACVANGMMNADSKSIQIIGAHGSACVCIVFVVSKHLICICFFARLTCIRFMVSAF